MLYVLAWCAVSVWFYFYSSGLSFYHGHVIPFVLSSSPFVVCSLYQLMGFFILSNVFTFNFACKATNVFSTFLMELINRKKGFLSDKLES